MKPHKFRLWHSGAILYILLFFLIGCKGEKPIQTSENIPLPPSLQSPQNHPIQTVTLDSAMARRITIRTIKIQQRHHAMRFPVPAVVEPDPDYFFIVSSPVEGRVIEIAHFEGETVEKGQILFKIQSVVFANQLAELLQSQADLKYYQSTYERLKKLAKQKITTERALQKAEADYLRAVAIHQAARAKIRAMGIPEANISAMLSDGTREPYLPIFAPSHGTITMLHIQQGQPILPADQLCTITNFSRLRVKGFIAPDELALVSVNDSVEIYQKSVPGLKIAARIQAINPSLEPQHKSIVVYVPIQPQKNWPLPGQNVRMTIFSKTKQKVIAIPLKAIEFEKDSPYVFVKRSWNTYEKRPITIHRTVGTMAIIQSGLQEGEEVAINQIFTLKALSRFEEFAED